MLVTIDVSDDERSALMNMNLIEKFVIEQSCSSNMMICAKTMHELSKRIIHELTESEVRKAYRSCDVGKSDCLTQNEIRFVKILYGELAVAVEEIAQDRGELTKAMRELIMLHGDSEHIEINGEQHKWVMVKREKEKQHFPFP